MKNIMSNLLFPAFLGTGIVLVVTDLLKAPSVSFSLELVFAFELALYYVAAYALVSRQIAYDWQLFVLDFVVSILILAGFLALGFGDRKMSQGNFVVFFRLISWAIVIEWLWSLAAGRYSKTRTFVMFIAAVIFLKASFFVPTTNLWPWSLAVLLFGLICWYYFYIPLNGEKADKAS